MSEENSMDLENKRLEVEKMKLEVEMKKLDLEKAKLVSDTSNQSASIISKSIWSTWNVLAVVFGVISILTLFLPWVEGVATGRVSIFGYNSSSSVSSGDLSGISTSEGQFCLLLTIVGIILNIKGKRIAGVFGIICTALIFIFIARMEDYQSSVSATGVSGSFEMKILSTILFSIVSYMLYSIFSIWNFFKNKVARANIVNGILQFFCFFAIVGLFDICINLEEYDLLNYSIYMMLGILFIYTISLLITKKYFTTFLLILPLLFLGSVVLTNNVKLYSIKSDEVDQIKYLIIRIFLVLSIVSWLIALIVSWLELTRHSYYHKLTFIGQKPRIYFILGFFIIVAASPVALYSIDKLNKHELNEDEIKSITSNFDELVGIDYCFSEDINSGSVRFYIVRFLKPEVAWKNDFGNISVDYSILISENLNATGDFDFEKIQLSNKLTETRTFKYNNVDSNNLFKFLGEYREFTFDATEISPDTLIAFYTDGNNHIILTGLKKEEFKKLLISSLNNNVQDFNLIHPDSIINNENTLIKLNADILSNEASFEIKEESGNKIVRNTISNEDFIINLTSNQIVSHSRFSKTNMNEIITYFEKFGISTKTGTEDFQAIYLQNPCYLIEVRKQGSEFKINYSWECD